MVIMPVFPALLLLTDGVVEFELDFESVVVVLEQPAVKAKRAMVKTIIGRFMEVRNVVVREALNDFRVGSRKSCDIGELSINFN